MAEEIYEAVLTSPHSEFASVVTADEVIANKSDCQRSNNLNAANGRKLLAELLRLSAAATFCR